MEKVNFKHNINFYDTISTETGEKNNRESFKKPWRVTKENNSKRGRGNIREKEEEHNNREKNPTQISKRGEDRGERKKEYGSREGKEYRSGRGRGRGERGRGERGRGERGRSERGGRGRGERGRSERGRGGRGRGERGRGERGRGEIGRGRGKGESVNRKIDHNV